MKKFFNYIINGLAFIGSFLFIVFLIGILFIYTFSLKNDMSFQSTISYLKTILAEVTDLPFFNEDLENILVNTNIPTENSTTNMSNNTNNYYYKQLNDTAKIIYNTLEININNLKKENYIIDFSTTFNDLLNKTTGQYELNKAFQSALDAFYYEHPDLFYIDLTKFSLNTKCISIGNNKIYMVQIIPQDNKNYLHSSFKSEQEVNTAIAKVENIKNNIINTVADKDLYNKIKGVHDILVNSIEYDTSLNKSNAHNIYGALVEKKVVCEGYAKAFKYLLDSLDIECILVSGTATNSSNNSEAHMWNYVKLKNAWYGVDVTWDDPIINGNTSQTIKRDYLLKRNSIFIYSHNPSGKISDTGMLFTLPTLSNSNY